MWLTRHYIIGWRIPLAMWVGVLAPAVLFWLIDSQHYARRWYTCYRVACGWAAFFIATDPADVVDLERRAGDLRAGLRRADL